ncbi:MAG: FAD-dependent monooxygenase [Acidobacteria bacterium]|nr:FAD-dependent monooxygenase [Acidobacteriota bacterium]
MSKQATHYVAVIGGAVAGSVAAEILAEHGIQVVIIEQNKKPYGKIEDGLPRWHREQRKQEYARIDARLKKPGVTFIPSTRLGSDLDFKELIDQWGFSAVVLANGAWRDRNVGVEGADEYIDKGLIYQNPFIYWYNHKNEKSYSGPRYEAPDETLVLGGGLASIDVVKILQLETYERALRAKGVETDMHELEKKGIPAICKNHNIEPQELGVKGCLLIYRRRMQDMPLAQPPDNATPEQLARTEGIRQKLLSVQQKKYLFRFQDRRLTGGLIVENGRLVGLKLSETHVEGRKATPIPGTEHELRSPLIISSIGSVPEIIPGIAMKGEYYTFKDWDLGYYAGSDRVFGVGNVVTGQGNIRASLVHSQKVANHLIENYMGVGESGDISGFTAPAEGRAAAQAEQVKERIQSVTPLSEAQVKALEQRISAAQKKAGYGGDYDAWIAKVTPPDLE